MSEIGSISVRINGDASGLLSAAASAQSALSSLTSAVNGLTSQNVSLTLAAVDNASPVISAAAANAASFSALKPQASITALDNTSAGVASARAAVSSIPDRVVTITVRVNQEGSIPNFASGTRSAPAGLARINDEEGARDPRELIYHRGRYYMFEGRDILLPLDKGDKVFTASQTKNIMRLAGVPSYASGKNNELFEYDKKIFKHITGTSNMTVSEQIEWWKYALEQYAYDSEAVMECQEEIFELTKKLVKELNGVSEVYVSERSQLNDWDAFGDSALEAFSRIRDRNYAFLEEGVITWEDYCETLGDIGAEMYEERVEHSRNWLEQQYKYHDMSVEDYIAGLDRMAAYTQEYYDSGLIGAVDYFYGMQEIENERFEMQRAANEEEYRAWQKSAEGYKKQRETYGDWEAWGDSLSDYYDRCIERQEEFFAAGIIDWETYNDAVIGYRLEQYEAEQEKAEDAYKTMLSYAKDYIANVKDIYGRRMDALKYENDSDELDEEYAEAALTRSRYKNAVTQRGRDVLADAEKTMREIEREREELELERERNETLARLEAQYDAIENNKSVILKGLADGSLNINTALEAVSAQAAAGQNNICSLLSELIRAVRNGGGTVYGGNTYNITGADTSFIGAILQRSAAAFR